MKKKSSVAEKGIIKSQYRDLDSDVKKIIDESIPELPPRTKVVILPPYLRSFTYNNNCALILFYHSPLDLILRSIPHKLTRGGYCYIPPTQEARIRKILIVAAAFFALIIVGSWAYQCQAEYGTARIARIIEGGYQSIDDVPADYWGCENIPEDQEGKIRCLLSGLRFKRIHDSSLFALYDRLLEDENIGRGTKKYILTRAYHEAEWHGIKSLALKYSEWKINH